MRKFRKNTSVSFAEIEEREEIRIEIKLYINLQEFLVAGTTINHLQVECLNEYCCRIIYPAV